MNMIPLLAETAGNLSRTETFVTALPYVSGALVVFVTLSILWGVCAFTGWLIKTLVPAALLEPAALAVALAPDPPPAAGSVPPSTPLSAADTRLSLSKPRLPVGRRRVASPFWDPTASANHPT